MKKKTVIELEKFRDSYIAKIFGQVGKNRTDELGCCGASKLECIEHIATSTTLNEIEQWMEQIQ